MSMANWVLFPLLPRIPLAPAMGASREDAEVVSALELGKAARVVEYTEQLAVGQVLRRFDLLLSSRLQHVLAFTLEDSPYLILGFEDLWGGGDRDYNDLIFAVDVGEANVEVLNKLASPEPGMAMSLVVFVAIGLAFHRSSRLVC